MRLAPMEVLSAEEIRRISDAAIHILEHAGVEVLGAAMLDLLAARGCQVDRERGVVRFSRAMIEDCVAQVPRSFEVFDRSGRPAFLLGDGNTKIAAGTTEHETYALWKVPTSPISFQLQLASGRSQ